jgi:hypothetical protein
MLRFFAALRLNLKRDLRPGNQFHGDCQKYVPVDTARMWQADSMNEGLWPFTAALPAKP